MSTYTKEQLWDIFNSALMSRCGITLDTPEDCHKAVQEWARDSDNAYSWQIAYNNAIERHTKIQIYADKMYEHTNDVHYYNISRISRNFQE